MICSFFVMLLLLLKKRRRRNLYGLSFFVFFDVVKRWQMQKSDKVYLVAFQVWLNIFIEWRNDLYGFTVCLHSTTTLFCVEKETSRNSLSYLCYSRWLFSALLLLLWLLYLFNSFGLECVPEFLLFQHSLQ